MYIVHACKHTDKVLYMNIIIGMIYRHLIYSLGTCTIVISTSLLKCDISMATIGCSFLHNQSFYCVVCCSTDPSVPPDSSVYNISTSRGTEVTVDLDGLTSGQMYYCKAAATNTNSASCGGPVVGGVKVFFSFMTTSISKTPPTNSKSTTCSK